MKKLDFEGDYTTENNLIGLIEWIAKGHNILDPTSVSFCMAVTKYYVKEVEDTDTSLI